MLPNNVPTSYAYDLRHLAEWIADNANDDPIDQAIGRLLKHVAHGYGGLQCDGLGADKYMRRAAGLDHQRLIALGEQLATTVMLNHHAPRRELRPWQTKIGYGGRLLAGATWLKDSTTALDQVTRAIARLLDHIGEQYDGVVVNGRDHHELLTKRGKQLLYAVITNYPRKTEADPEPQQPEERQVTQTESLASNPEQEALNLLRSHLIARPTVEPQR